MAQNPQTRDCRVPELGLIRGCATGKFDGEIAGIKRTGVRRRGNASIRCIEEIPGVGVLTATDDAAEAPILSPC